MQGGAKREFKLTLLLFFGLTIVGLVMWLVPRSHPDWDEDHPEASAPISTPTTAATKSIAAPESTAPQSETPTPTTATSGPNSMADAEAMDQEAPIPTEQVIQLLDAAQQALQAENWADAENLYRQVLQMDPNNEQALMELAMIQSLDKKDYKAATPYLQQVLRVNPKNPTAMDELITSARETGKMNDAIAFLKDLENTQGPNPNLTYGLGRALQAKGYLQESIGYYEKTLQNGKQGNTEVMENLADAYLQNGDYNNAEKNLRNALQKSQQEAAQTPNSTQSRENLLMLKIKYATLLLDGGKLGAAESELTELERLSPGHDIVVSLRHELDAAKRRPPESAE